MLKHASLPQAFAELGLETPILQALVEIGFETPSEIQKELIPPVLAGRDVLGQARTGTGKTAAFALPLLQKIDPEDRLQAMVLTPTRELAAQVLGDFRRFASKLPIHCVPVYGGHGLRQQMHQLGRRPHVVIGTPGRVMDLMRRRVLSFDALRFVVLDEVDRMLDIGFRDDVRKILSDVRGPHQTIFVSATIDPDIRQLAHTFMNDPLEVNVSRDVVTVEQVAQHFITVDPWDKFQCLHKVIQQEKPGLMIIFTNTKHGARKLAKRLHAVGVEAKEIHGDLVQEKRERIMSRFRRHQIPILVATDLASRGIDVSNITHIVNYDIPPDPQVYVHRIGRTARMGAFGRAISLVMRDQGKELTQIEMLINKQLQPLLVDGFEATPPPRESEFESRGRGPGGRPAPAAASGAAPVATAPPPVTKPKPRTLGGKFPLARKRRL